MHLIVFPACETQGYQSLFIQNIYIYTKAFIRVWPEQNNPTYERRKNKKFGIVVKFFYIHLPGCSLMNGSEMKSLLF